MRVRCRPPLPGTSTRKTSPAVISTGSRPGQTTAQRPEGCIWRMPSFSDMLSPPLCWATGPFRNHTAMSAMAVARSRSR